jgi:hypothetical protein
LFFVLAFILLHDIFAPHPFASPVVLSCGSISIQAIDEGHPSTGGFVEDDESTSVPNRRGTLTPFLSVNFSDLLHPFFHPFLLITADERPPKA